MRRNDYLLCLVIITAALCGFWYSDSTAADSNAVVRITRHHELILQQTPVSYTHLTLPTNSLV